MCGIACYIGDNKEEGVKFSQKAIPAMKHRGPDDDGVYTFGGVTLVHLRLSILELSALGHQPLLSSCGRYHIIFNGEVYNHLELRDRFLKQHPFRGHSDTETIVELFRLQGEKMLEHMVGMWAIVIWDEKEKKIFISRDRYGQKPIYTRKRNNGDWYISSEMKVLIEKGETMQANATAITEYIALGNYGHLGNNTFFKDIHHFPQGCYAWLRKGDAQINAIPYWVLPNIKASDKQPFNETVKKKLHDTVVEAVLSQTLADVSIGITLSGGIDSSIVAGILSTHYDKKIHVFTAQTPNSKYDETKYVDAVIKKWNDSKFIVHRKNLNVLSIKQDLLRYIKIQEEPFGDPSIIAHGTLMEMAADAGIKVILNGQGADEVFFGYNNLAQATLPSHIKAMKFNSFYRNVKAMNLGTKFMMRAFLQTINPDMDFKLRQESRIKRRSNISPEILAKVDESTINMYSYKNLHDVWKESLYGTQLPHLVQYDDRNGMAYSVEGRSPFLDHRIAEVVATIKPEAYLKNGLRKYILRESCRRYLPDEVYNRTDKIGFFTPLANALMADNEWVHSYIKNISFIKPAFRDNLTKELMGSELSTPDALHIWRQLSVCLWMEAFQVSQ